MKKLYIVVRADLGAGLQMAQACHALQAFNDQHPEEATRWEGNLVVLAAPNQAHLSALACDLGRARHAPRVLPGARRRRRAHGDRGGGDLPLALRPSRAAA